MRIWRMWGAGYNYRWPLQISVALTHTHTHSYTHTHKHTHTHNEKHMYKKALNSLSILKKTDSEKSMLLWSFTNILMVFYRRINWTTFYFLTSHFLSLWESSQSQQLNEGLWGFIRGIRWATWYTLGECSFWYHKINLYGICFCREFYNR